MYYETLTQLCKSNLTSLQKLVLMTKRRCLAQLRTPGLGNKVKVWLVHTFWVELCRGTINAHVHFLFHRHEVAVISLMWTFDSIITRFIWCSIMVYTFADQTVVYSFVWFSYLWICFCIRIIFKQMSFKQWPVEDSVPQIHHYNISILQVLSHPYFNNMILA